MWPSRSCNDDAANSHCEHEPIHMYNQHSCLWYSWLVMHATIEAAEKSFFTYPCMFVS